MLAREKILEFINKEYEVSNNPIKAYPCKNVNFVTRTLIANYILDYEKIYYHSKKETGPLVFKINNSDLVFIVSPYKDEELENNQLLITCY
jgi:hypothetical protein